MTRSSALIVLCCIVLCIVFCFGACKPQVDYEGTQYQCPDGICPIGFHCVDGQCIPDGQPPPPEPDAAGTPPVPDAAVPSPDAAPAPPENMVAVAEGPFEMGCNFMVDANCPIDAVPHRQVFVSAFLIDVHEVTQGEYDVCVQAGTCPLPDPDAVYEPVDRADHPVTGISWWDAFDYCAFVEKRLPTEAEWEKAARGTDARVYPWGNQTPNCARVNYSACTDDTVPVGSHAGDASPYGATEMAGNAAEWVADWYDDAYYFNGPDTDPQGPSNGSVKVVRGGGFRSSSSDLRAYDREYSDPDSDEDDNIGFRCAR